MQIRGFGSPEVLEPTTLPEPVAKDGEVLVDVEAAGVNFVDVLTRAGRAPGGRTIGLPAVLGSEIGGVVIDAGPRAEGLEVGSRIVAGTGGLGGYAETARVSAANAVIVPPGMTVDDAVALFVHGRTALALSRRVRISRDDRTLVMAGAGGVGSMLVQLARAEGAIVVAVASGERKTQLAKELGAAVALDSSEPTWPERVRNTVGEVDVVLDGVGGRDGRAAFDLLAPRGRVAIFGSASGAVTAASLSEVLQRAITVVGFGGGKQFTTPDEPRMLSSDILALAAAGTVRPVIGQRFDLHDAAAAHRAVESRTTIGKTLLLPKGG